MNWISLGARVVLAIVFAVAAGAKLADQAGVRSTLSEFGLPERSLRPAALLLPLAEFVTAVALLIEPSARWGAAACLALLLLFGAGIAAAMRRGEAPECNCFGQLSSAPAGRGTLIRNAVLGIPALFLIVHGAGDGAGSWFAAGSSVSVFATCAAIVAVVLGAMSAQLATQNSDLRRRLDRQRAATAAFPPGLPVGARAPAFALPGATGQASSLGSFLALGRRVALVFVSPTCGPCEAMFPTLARWQQALAEQITIVIIGSGDGRELRAMAELHGLQNLLADKDDEVFDTYRITATPSALILAPDGTIATPTRGTQAIVEAMIREALRTAAQNDVQIPSEHGLIEVVQSAGSASHG